MESKRRRLTYNLGCFLGMLLLVGIDQWTKYLAVVHLKGQEALELLPGVFELSYLENMGAAFGMFENKRWIFLLGTCLILAVALFLFLRFPKEKHYLPFLVTVTVIAAGGLGNMIDRLRLGYVVDFLYFSLIDFPVFNVADVYVTVGVAVFAVLYLISGEEDFDCLFSKKR